MSTVNSKLRFFKLVGISLAIIVLIALPKNYFDQGQSICLFTLLSGYTCPACGLTKAMMHLIHLDFETAWRYNKISFVVSPLFLYLILKYYWQERNFIVGWFK